MKLVLKDRQAFGKSLNLLLFTIELFKKAGTLRSSTMSLAFDIECCENIPHFSQSKSSVRSIKINQMTIFYNCASGSCLTSWKHQRQIFSQIGSNTFLGP